VKRTRTEPEKLLSSRQAAHYLNVSERTVEYLRLSGKGPPFQKLGYKTVRYRRSDLDAWLDERREQERAAITPITGDWLMQVLQTIIAQCAYGGMATPFDIIVHDADGQRIGTRVFEDRDPEPLPGLTQRTDAAQPPFVVEVTDAEGERRTFDVGVLAAPGARRVPDIRTRH